LDEPSPQATSREERNTSSHILLDTLERDTGAVGADSSREKKGNEASNELSSQSAASPPAGQEIGDTPPSRPSASESTAPLAEDSQAQAERAAQARYHRYLLAELQHTREKARGYRLSSTERLQAKLYLRALEFSWDQEFPDDPAGWG
jgi:hypothetical protein